MIISSTISFDQTIRVATRSGFSDFTIQYSVVYKKSRIPQGSLLARDKSKDFLEISPNVMDMIWAPLLPSVSLRNFQT